ncbi:MAG: O-antigen ligase domain-containing protein [Hyphomicrobiales bacterium]|nr:MAG: O-antigen ligase domain-containing protein [Hyphomicrobiales bacterium]
MQISLMTAVMLAIAAGSLLFLAYVTFGPLWLGMGMVITSVCIVPRNLLGASPADYGHAGVAGAHPRLTTYALVFALIAVVIVGFRVRGTLSTWTTAFLFFMTAGMALWWNANSEQWAGYWQYALVPLGWLAGTAFGSATDSNGRSGQTLAGWIAFLVGVQLSVSLFQFLGFPVFTPDAFTAEVVGARVNGTLSHPTTLGKILLLAIVLVLPLTRSTNARTRWLANASIIGSLPLFVLSGGRANLLAVGILLVTWVIMLPRDQAITLRKMIAPALFVGAVSSLGMLRRRFQEDPFGENRIHFMQVAFGQIVRRPLAGTGPNAYVSTAGQYDALTAEGWPVHNTPLLAVGELGIVGAVILFTPIVLVTVHAWRVKNRHDMSGTYAKAYLASTPGIFIIAMTGWGMLNGEVLGFWFFVAAFVSVKLVNQTTPGKHVDDDNHVIRTKALQMVKVA